MKKLIYKLGEDIKALGEDLIALSEAFEARQEKPCKKGKKDSEVKDSEVAVADQGQMEDAVPTLEQVRAELADLARKGFQNEIRALIVSHGVNTLSDLDPGLYKELLAKAREACKDD